MRPACTHSGSTKNGHVPTRRYYYCAHHPSVDGWSNTILLTMGSPRIFPQDFKKGCSSVPKDVIKTYPSCLTKCRMTHSRLIYSQPTMYSTNHFTMYLCVGINFS